MQKLKVLDLFSGIGGFSLGLERTGGFETVAFCEIDKFCQKVLKKHWPDVPIYNDVEDLNYEGTVDVICGGFPCQDISVGGQGAGLSGKRSGLWFEYKRIIKEVGPKFVVIENVTALRVRGLITILQDLWKIGYDAEWYCIPASAVGAPHQRDRVWIVARPNNGSKRVQRVIQEALQRFSTFSWCEDVRRIEDLRGRSDIPEPLVRRNSNGVSERLHALGNSVVPQIPEAIGNAILESEFHYA